MNPVALRSLPALLALSALAQAQVTFSLELIATGFDRPTSVCAPPIPSNRLFVTEKDGVVRTLINGVPQLNPWVNLSSKVDVTGQTGLVTMVFHPNYAQNGFVYFFYANSTASIAVERFRVPVPSNYQIDPASATVILSVQDVISFHNGGGMAFGPDGYLYVALGDRRKELEGTGCTAQDGSTLVGKLLRLDADGNPAPGNPFLQDPNVEDRIYGFGLREPFRIAFDHATGDLYVGDVGDQSREEISVVPAGAPPPNFGWRILEGTLCASTLECTAWPCPNPQFIPPAFEYDATGDCFAVVGGAVYRGAQIPELSGQYLFADWCSSQLFALRWIEQRTVYAEELTNLVQVVIGSQPGAPTTLERPVHITEDTNGELLVLAMGPDVPVAQQKPGLYRVKPALGLSLRADDGELSLSSAQPLKFDLQAGLAHAGRPYLLLGSASGYKPGLSLDGLTLPLVLDDYLLACLQGPGATPLENNIGLLDSAGAARSALLPGKFPAVPGLIGQVLHHAALAIDPAQEGAVVFVSNPLSVALLP
jgi:glucose/arabinose dehydrogenase